MIKTYIKILIASFLVVFYASIAVAANAPVTTLPTVANVTAGTVAFPLP
jgi:hypothetical protein